MIENNNFPKRNEIWLINLPNQSGNETKNKRFALVASNNIHNYYASRIIIIPITSVVKKIYPFEICCQQKPINGKLMLDQIRSCDKKRFIKKVATYKNSEWTFLLKKLLEI